MKRFERFRLTHPARADRGMTLPMTALFIVVLFAMASLAVDIGMLYTARTSAQHAADAAALAGAYVFYKDSTLTNAEYVDQATAAAVAVGNRYDASGNPQFTVLGKKITISAANVSVDTTNRRVTVTVPMTGASAVSLYFARILGLTSADVQVKAVAEAERSISGTGCLKPFVLANSALGPNSSTQNCTSKQTFYDPNCSAQPCQPTTYAVGSGGGGQLGQPLPTFWNDTGSPSHWDLLNLSGGPGNAVGPLMTCTIEGCLGDCAQKLGISSSISCGDKLWTNNGAKVGMIDKQLKNLIGYPNNDTFGGLGVYIPAGGGAPRDTSPSLITVAVYQDCLPAGITLSPGSQQIPIIGYVHLFIDGVGDPKTKGITAHLVSVDSCDINSGGAGGNSVTQTIRLIQQPAQ